MLAPPPWTQHRHVVVHRQGFQHQQQQLPRWVVEMALEFLTAEELSAALTSSARWFLIATTGAWSERQWARHRFGSGVEEEDARRHCCARGKFLALAYAPSRQAQREGRRLRKRAAELRREWHLEREPYVRSVRSRQRHLSVVAALCVGLLFRVCELREASLALLWPVRFAWHASSIARLAHKPLVHYSRESIFLEHAFPVAHALAAPDALELRRYAFGTSLACLVVAVALLLAWWRCLWYSLGAVISEFLGLSTFDVASAELRLKKLKESSAARENYHASLAEERRFVSSNRGVFLRLQRRHNPYRGHDDQRVTRSSWWHVLSSSSSSSSSRKDESRRLMTLGDVSQVLVFGRGKSALRVARSLTLGRLATRLRDLEKRRLLSVTAELNRPLLRLLFAASAFVLLALVAVVLMRDRQTKWHVSYVLRATVIFVAAIRQDVLPVFLVFLKLASHLSAACLRRALSLLSPFLCLGFLLALLTPPPDDERRRKRPSFCRPCDEEGLDLLAAASSSTTKMPAMPPPTRVAEPPPAL